MNKLDQLSIFLPAYNEEKNIVKAINNVYKYIHKVAKKFEILVIDDGSTDQTAAEVKKLQKKIKSLRLIVHKKNKGYGGAIKTGLKQAKYDWMGYIDSDGQFDFAEIKKFIPYTQDNDLVIGYRLNRSDSWYRRLLQKILHVVGLVLFDLDVNDTDCGFKLIKSQVIKKIMPLSTESAITETEILARAHQAGFKIHEVSVHHHARKDGEQTGGKLSIVWRAAYEGLGLWWQLLDKKSFFILIIILGLAVFLRLYQIRDYLTFLGDEGRDVLVVKHMLVDHKFTLLGPIASVAGFYLGPIYYYFMLLPLWLSGLDPVGPAIMVTIFGIISVWLVYKVAKKFNVTAGLLAAFFYATSPIVVHYSRNSWNPNLVPFFSLLMILFLRRGIKKVNPRIWFWLGICLGVTLQLHYLAMLLVPMTVISSLILLNKKYWLKSAGWCLLGGLIGFSPFLAFEVRHGFLNTQTVFEFITREEGAVGFKSSTYFKKVYMNGRRLFEEVLWLKDWSLQKLALGLGTLITLLLRSKLPIVSLWFFLGLVGMALYRGSVYDYYFGFLFPIPIILLAVFLSWLWSKQFLFKLITLAIFILITVSFYQNLYFHTRPSRMIEQTKEISQFILDKTQGEEFNFALITAGNSDHSYRYFFEIMNRNPLGLEEKVTKQLLVLCEQPDCQPLGHPLWEVAGFGRAEIDQSWTVGPEFKVYRLIHHPDSMDLIGQPVKQGGF